ncbi:unsaturated glucuronyl hydrolase [Penicillium verhagenii]|uniref:unsaturated glucuronyl hydrolase n=1 Tax=Penicillium verhagenii TaxID=1562060 RepID=UPI0025457940|nr:unsaturated glucuronyl hydrolase [Penicillium verhagenii]KAJ5928338.1 unsaturated glucuronyl hydrolase [Penicillium verhagenii]
MPVLTSPSQSIKEIVFDEKMMIPPVEYPLTWTNNRRTADTKATASSIMASLPIVEATELMELYSENVVAKIWRVADSFISKHPSFDAYPEHVPESGPSAGTYETKPAKFWTCGFFPSSLYCVLERYTKFPNRTPFSALPSENIIPPDSSYHAQLLALCRAWSTPLRAQASRTDTHDLGFMMHPLRMDWELTGDSSSLKAYITAANSLASRFDERVGAIRSWDQMKRLNFEVHDKENNFLIIVDNMDLLFYSAHHSHNQQLAVIAKQHARTVMKTLIRPDDSTWHVANLDQHAPQKCTVKYRMTHQGLADDSTWSRGQAWVVLGFAQTYMWTGDFEFLAACLRLTEYFLARLKDSPAQKCPWVPLWDFSDRSGEVDSTGDRLRDASAGMIAANGMLLLHQALLVRRNGADNVRYDGRRYLDAALNIASDTIQYAVDKGDNARLEVDENGKVKVPAGSWDAILRHSTANNNPDALVRYKDHGLVYADYYFLEFGNKLLRMGLI